MAQTTSIRCDGTYGAHSSANFPAGAFSWQLRINWLSFTSSNGAQNVVSTNMGASTIQVYLDTASQRLRVYSSSNNDDRELINLTGKSAAWGTLGMRWSGSGGLTVWYLDDATDTWTEVSPTGTAAAMTQVEIAKYSFGGEEPNQLAICTFVLHSGYKNQAECTAQALSDTVTSTATSGATLNRIWRLDSAANATDSSGNGYNGTVYSGGTTISNVPYVSDQTVAPDAAVTYPTRFEPTVALGTPGAISADFASARPAGFEPAVALGTPLALTADVASSLPSVAEPAVAIGSGTTIAPDAASPAPNAAEPAVALGTPGAITTDAASASPSAPAPVVSIATEQATSVGANSQFGLQVPLAVTNLPPGEFTLMVQARVNDWTVGDPLGNILAANCLNGYVQIFADIDDPLGNGDRFIRVYQGEEATPVYYDLNDVQEFSGWALFAIRNDGAGGDTEVVMIPRGGSPIVLPMTGDFGRLRQFYVLGLVTVAEQAEDVDACTVICFADYKDNTFLLSQAEVSSPLATANRFYPLDDAATAHIDQSGNGFDANHAGTGITVSDSPYLDTDQDVAPDAAITRPAAFEPAVALGTPLALTADVGAPAPSTPLPAVALGTPGALTGDVASVAPSTLEPTVVLGTAGAVSPDAASVAPSAAEPTVALGTPLAVAPDAGTAVPSAVEPIVQIGGATLEPETAAAGPSAAEPAVALGTPGALTADVASAAPAATEPTVALGTALSIASDAASVAPSAVEPEDVYSGAVTITPDAASAGPIAPEPEVELNAIVLYPDFGVPRDSTPLPVVALGSALAIDVDTAIEQPLALVVDIATGLPLELAPDVGMAAPSTPLPGVEVVVPPETLPPTRRLAVAVRQRRLKAVVS